jgi:hypothetical protein
LVPALPVPPPLAGAVAVAALLVPVAVPVLLVPVAVLVLLVPPVMTDPVIGMGDVPIVWLVISIEVVLVLDALPGVITCGTEKVVV